MIETSDTLRQQRLAWDDAFATALEAAAQTVPGLLFRIPPGQTLPALQWAGDTRGAYWASAGLGASAQAFVRLRYLREAADGDGPFERDDQAWATLNVGTADPGLVAALMVAAVQHHRASLPTA